MRMMLCSVKVKGVQEQTSTDYHCFVKYFLKVFRVQVQEYPLKVFKTQV